MPKFIAAFITLLCTYNNGFCFSADSDTNITISDKKDFYSFEYNKKEKRVEIKENVSASYLCNQFRTTVPVVESYNDETSIDEVRIFVNGERNKYIKPRYEYYSVEGTFYSDARVCYFGLPLEKKGTTSQVEFEKTMIDPRYFTSIFFSEQYKIANQQVTVAIPRWMKVELKEMNFKGFNISKAIVYDSKKDADIYTYTIANLPARVSEDNAPGATYVLPHLLVLSRSAVADGTTFTYFNTIKEQYAWYHSLVKDLVTDEDAMKAKVQEITAGKTTDIEKIKSIYYWVQDNIRYVAFEDGLAGFRPEKAQLVLNKKYGDCKGMANLTKGLLRAAGYDARLCWLGTHHIAYDYSTPSLAVDNHMICALIYQGKKYFLDATEKYMGFDQYAERIQGRQILIENGDNYLLEKVPSTNYPQNTEYEKRVLTINGANLEGAVERKWKGESKEYMLYQVNNLKKDKVNNVLQEYLSESNDKYQIENFENSDLSNWDKDLDIKYKLVHKEAVSNFGDELYIDLDFRKELSGFTIDVDKRKQDYLFDYKMNVVHETEITIPANYKVQQMPPAIKIDRPSYSFKTELNNVNGKLTYKKELILKQTKLPVASFAQWNSDVEQLKKAYLEQLILVKK